MLCGKLITIRRITWIRNPTIIYTSRINRIWHSPVSSIRQQTSTWPTHILAFCCTRHMILHSGHLFCWPPLITKHIDVRRIARIRHPRIVPFTVYHSVPTIVVLWQQFCSRPVHVLALSCTRHCIFYCGHFVSRPPLIAKHIDVRRIMWMRRPSVIKVNIANNSIKLSRYISIGNNLAVKVILDFTRTWHKVCA